MNRTPNSEAQTYTLPVDLCQHRELMELLDIQAAHLQQRQAKQSQQQLHPGGWVQQQERPGAGRLARWLAAGCALILGATVLALWWM